MAIIEQLKDKSSSVSETITTVKLADLTEKYASSVYDLTKAEFDGLKTSIAENGVQLPIIINPDRVILDGHHRVKASRELGNATIPATSKTFADKLSELAFVISSNLERRQLNDYQKIELCSQLNELESKQANLRQTKGERLASNGVKGKTSEIVAAKAGVSTRTYERGIYVIKHADDQTKARLRKSELSISQSYNYYKSREQHRKLESEIPQIDSSKASLILGDFRNKSSEIADNSIALIFTDPPYNSASLPLYAELGKLAARVLMDGGSLFTFFNQAYLREVYDSLAAAGLSYHWVIAVIHKGGKTAAYPQKVTVTWKPLLWFRKGMKLRTSDGNIKDSVVSSKPDKFAHKWAQSIPEAAHVISKLTVKGDTVFDPMMGSGITGLAAIELDRNFIGIDNDKKAFHQAQSFLSS
jgi:DNA methylase/ParB/Sulfiredoxin domain